MLGVRVIVVVYAGEVVVKGGAAGWTAGGAVDAGAGVAAVLWAVAVVRVVVLVARLVGVACAAAVVLVFVLVMPEPNSCPELELPDGCPRALASGIEYSFAAGLPGSTWTPGGVFATASPDADTSVSAATATAAKDRDTMPL